MKTISEVFKKRYAYDRVNKDPESFIDFVKSQTSISNLARATGVSYTTISRKFDRPIILMKFISEHCDDLIETYADKSKNNKLNKENKNEKSR